MSGKLRVLVDRSKDAGAATALCGLLSHLGFETTDNRNRLSSALLERYDVLAICGQSLRRYSRGELGATEAFVGAGGGLLLASDVGAFEFEADAPVSELAENAVAGIFGAAFLPADCEGARVNDRFPLHLPPDSLKTARHPALGDAAPGLLARGGGPIRPPDETDILATHRRTGQPVAAAFRHGKGRVVMSGCSHFAYERPATSAELVRWLAQPRKRKDDGKPVPTLIGKRGGIQRGDRFHLRYDPASKDLVDEMLKVFGRAADVLETRFPAVWQLQRQFSLVDTLVVPTWDWWGNECIPVQAPAGSRTRHVVRALIFKCLRNRGFEWALLATFGQMASLAHLLTETLDELGCPDEASRLKQRADRWVSEMSPRQKTFDMARLYTATEESCPRGLPLIRECQETFGSDIFTGLAAALPEKDPHKNFPTNYAWESDVFIHALGVAAGKDAFPWFAQRGYTVHPLPPVRREAKDFTARMAKRLNEALRDPGEALSSRMDAALDLVTLAEDGKLGKDAWASLCRALRLSKAGDTRAPGKLRKLFSSGEPELRAIAGVALADLGEVSVADELVPLAKQFEPRFQLAAWYALSKAGAPGADELAPETLADADGNRAWKLDIPYDGYIQMHAEASGYRVANVFSFPCLHPFTADGAISVHEVHWVHTSPVWRRRGLSRYLMERTMNHPEARKCSTSELWTGTRNVAHTLYRDYGFTDIFRSCPWRCALPGNAPRKLPEGVSFREFRDGDEVKVRELARETVGNTMCFRGWDPGVPPPADVLFVAEKGRELVGYASATYSGGDEAHPRWLLAASPGGKPDQRDVKQPDDQGALIADALLGAVHAAAMALGAKLSIWHNPPEAGHIRRALGRAGYEHSEDGGVWMLQVRNLVQFLNEISPVIDKRLAKSDFKDWQGSIDLLAGRLQARLVVRRGKVSATRPGSRPADIVLSCDDDTATRIALGRETPFQAYLQTRLTIEPRVSEQITKLLEVIFPRVEY